VSQEGLYQVSAIGDLTGCESFAEIEIIELPLPLYVRAIEVSAAAFNESGSVITQGLACKMQGINDISQCY